VDKSLLPNPDDIRVDRKGDEWVLMYWVNDQTTLRIRLQHTSFEDPNDAICEVGEGTDPLFREVGRLMFAPLDLDPDWNQEPDLSDWPIEWRSEFVRLARVWCVCIEVADWGCAVGERQAEWEATLRSSLETTAAEPPPGSDQ
jgi:hypothetical protein